MNANFDLESDIMYSDFASTLQWRWIITHRISFILSNTNDFEKFNRSDT